ncbi:hypothetical protein H9P43_004774 [Blastocladiella emersonii ATCC 22665]|nr:hypothetical protein H9P43_004774 [Blastocladiella emersonii ATCC 22665]
MASPSKLVVDLLKAKGPQTIEQLFTSLHAAHAATIPTKSYLKRSIVHDLKRRGVVRPIAPPAIKYVKGAAAPSKAAAKKAEKAQNWMWGIKEVNADTLKAKAQWDKVRKAATVVLRHDKPKASDIVV